MPELEPDGPGVDPASRVRAAILEAVDGLIRREAKALGPEELGAFVAEPRGRPRFSAVDLLAPGIDDQRRPTRRHGASPRGPYSPWGRRARGPEG